MRYVLLLLAMLLLTAHARPRWGGIAPIRPHHHIFMPIVR